MRLLLLMPPHFFLHDFHVVFESIIHHVVGLFYHSHKALSKFFGAAFSLPCWRTVVVRFVLIFRRWPIVDRQMLLSTLAKFSLSQSHVTLCFRGLFTLSLAIISQFVELVVVDFG